MNDYSVIIPTKNQSIYLEESINSVINQQFIQEKLF